MNWSLSAAAGEELADAEARYDAEGAKLGGDFTGEVIATITSIAAHPTLSPLFAAKKIRRRLLNKFPYAIIYEITKEKIIILAIMHTSRRPGYWVRRVPKK